MWVRTHNARRWWALLAALAGVMTLALGLTPTANATSTVTIRIVGSGEGAVHEYAGPGLHDTTLDCHKVGSHLTGTCEEVVPDGQTIGLRARPASGSTFVGWYVRGEDHYDACDQFVQCYPTVAGTGGDVTVFAQFDTVPDVPLTVIKTGSAAGLGTVTSSPPGILCGLDCTDAFVHDGTVTLTATWPASVAFAGWGGDCSQFGTSPTCTLSMGGPRDVTARFDVATYTLSVAVSGNGTVYSAVQPGINCPGGACTANFPRGSQIELHATPSSGWKFSGWSGAGCTGTVDCTVTMSQAQAVAATFARAAVHAAIVGNRIRYTVDNVRSLQVTVDAGETVRVLLRIRRSDVTLQLKRFVVVGPDVIVLRTGIAQSIEAGKAKLEIVITNEAGTQKTVTRNLKIPAPREHA